MTFVHIVPKQEGMFHEPFGCWCEPDIELVNGGGQVITHRNMVFDERRLTWFVADCDGTSLAWPRHGRLITEA